MDIQIEYQGVLSDVVTVPVLPSRPGIFSLDGSGQGLLAILNQDGSVNSPSNPAARGSIVTIYATGGDERDPAVADGQILSDVLPRTYLRLISKPEDYVARVAFAYPEDDTRKWQQQLAAEQALAKQEKHVAEVPPAMITVEKVNFDYTIRGGDEHLRPVREAPVLLVVGKDGKGEMTNYRVKDQTYIVDRIFDHANLVLGSGKKAQKVEISRGHNQ